MTTLNISKEADMAENAITEEEFRTVRRIIKPFPA
jgi:hypothetical protein